LNLIIYKTIITAVAIGSLYYSSTSVLQKYPATEILFAGETVEPFSSLGGLVEIDFANDLFLGVRPNPQDQRLILSLVNENGQMVISSPIEGVYFEKLSDIESGWYQFEITNFGGESVKIYAILTAHDMREDFETIGELAIYAIVGLVLILPGIILILCSGSFIVYKKIRRK